MPPRADQMVTVVLYRALLKSCRELEQAMHAGQHYAFVRSAVHTFAHRHNSSGLTSALKDRTAIEPAALTQATFRASRDPLGTDLAFSALRCSGSMIQWMRETNSYAETMEGVSDREANAQPAARMVAASIIRRSM
mmetsp:Transcript_23522/g.35191  ORF Transcript_23522/g.35191 Transcript_23522/m.35191 type:complete len:136 (-) Transcript_23522:191-598(-)